MCSPILSIGATLVSGIYAARSQRAAANYQASSTLYQAQNEAAVNEYNAQATENISEYNANIAEANAAIYREAAVDAIQRGADEAGEIRQFGRAVNARGRAAAGSSGTVVDAGTNLEIMAQNSMVAEINALTAMNNAEREAYGYELQETALKNQATGTRYTGEIEAQNIRLGSEVGLRNAQAGAENFRYAGRLNSMSTYLRTGASVARQSVNLFPTGFGS